MQKKILKILTKPMTAWEIADELDRVDPHPCGYTYKVGWYLWYSIEKLLEAGKIRFCKEEMNEPQSRGCILFSKDNLLEKV